MEIKLSQKTKEKIKKLGIETVYLFGSYADEKFVTALSDIDIGIVFEEPQRYKDKTMKVYLKLYDIFTDILPKDYLKRRFKMRAHELDIVFLQFAPIDFQFNAIKNSKVLYEQNREKRFQYQEYVLKKYLDLKYLYNIEYKAILERI